jgi:peptidoglycan/LPS O-acetylase OafA/YrhL
VTASTSTGQSTFGVDRERTSSTPEKLGYRPELDGARALAIVFVLWNHLDVLDPRTLSWMTGNPSIGVDVFFTLSGFLITRLMLDEYYASGRFSVQRFLVRRARRLMPASLTVVGVVLLVVWLGDEPFGPMPNPDVSILRSAFGAAAYHMNILQLIPRLHHNWALTHTWSLSLEEQFYLIWPFVMLGILRVRRFDVRVRVAAVGCAIAVASTLWGWHLRTIEAFDQVYNGLDARAVQLAVGIALAAFTMLWPGVTQRLRWVGWPSGIGLCVVAFGHRLPAALDNLEYVVIALLASGLIVGCLERSGSLAAVARRGPLVELGKLSYSVYLVHYPVFFLLRHSLDTRLPISIMLVLGVAATSVLAAAMYFGVERRFRRVRPVPAAA